jgi:hypothetical protein
VTQSFPSPISRAGLPAELNAAEPQAAEARAERDRDDDAWALAIAQTLVEGVRPRLTLPDATEAASGQAAPGPTTAAASGASNDGEGPALLESGGETRAASASTGPALPTRLTTELTDSRLGRMELSVARGTNGLSIVINVADSHVKALIEAEQALLLKSLQGCGLRIDSVKIGSRPEAGTGLAPQEATQERAMARSRGNPNLRSGSARWRGYGAPADEDPEDDAERVDLTA